MADGSKIEWTDATWNPITGCSVVSPGCTNCYAMRLAGTRLAHHKSRAGLTRDSKAGPVWTGEVRLNEDWLDQPLRWRRPRMIFVCAHGDLFAEGVPDEWIDRVFAVMALAPQHTFQVLTKRPERMREYLTVPYRPGKFVTIDDDGRQFDTPGARIRVHAAMCDLFRIASPAALNAAAQWQDDHHPGGDGFMRRWPLPNVWLGVSAEDQARADERIPVLLDTPAAVRWVSAEPLLGPIDFGVAWHGEAALESECWGDCAWCEKGHPPLHNCSRGRQSSEAWEKGRSGLDWIVAGGESGPGARPMHPDWVSSIRDQCAAAGVPFHFKQWGEFMPSGQMDASGRAWNGRHEDGTHAFVRYGKKRAGRTLDGVTHDGSPQVAP